MSGPLEGIPAGGKNVFACPFPGRFAVLSYCEPGDAFGCCNVLSNKMLLGCKLLSVSHWENISLIREGFLLHKIVNSLPSIMSRIFLMFMNLLVLNISLLVEVLALVSLSLGHLWHRPLQNASKE